VIRLPPDSLGHSPSARDNTLRWKRRERIGAMPCLWHGGNPYAESEASNAAASGLHALTELPARHGQPMRSACQAAFDPEGGVADELRTGLERQLLLDVFPIRFNRLDA